MKTKAELLMTDLRIPEEEIVTLLSLNNNSTNSISEEESCNKAIIQINSFQTSLSNFEKGKEVQTTAKDKLLLNDSVPKRKLV